MSLTVYVSSVSGNTEMKKKQERISMVLTSKKISFTEIDICQDPSFKQKMRQIAGDSRALPPQICNGDVYCGDFIAFENAVECEVLEDFLKL